MTLLQSKEDSSHKFSDGIIVEEISDSSTRTPKNVPKIEVVRFGSMRSTSPRGPKFESNMNVPITHETIEEISDEQRSQNDNRKFISEMQLP